jgi:hypothetical protein
MKFRPSLFVATAFLAWGALAPSAAAQIGQCQNQRASNVESEYHQSSVSDNCNSYVVILGLRIVQNSSPCPTWQSYTPAHQACLGVANEGTNCVFDQNLTVGLRECECASDGSPLFGSVTERCRCGDATDGGTVEDFKTEDCLVINPPLT